LRAFFDLGANANSATESSEREVSLRLQGHTSPV
jgi:hypothetical protein